MRDSLGLIFEKFKLSEQAFSKWLNSTRIRMQEVNRIINRYQVSLGSNFIEKLKLANKGMDIRSAAIFIKMDYLLNKIKIKINLNNQIKLIISEIKQSQQKITSFDTILRINNPERQLRLGYSIIRSNGLIIKNVKNINIGDSLDITVSDGKFKTEVKNIN